ncbi:levansucrase [Streptomyces phaeolivaceus]|uniref:Levansucrase n=1 Tax=Streptomyces phaeolivaceus TaxID=2653200 RepID=A0A5P8K355_9ACTN|nr:levansucrase [Streptomyces phaeolivaceus]QFQ97695.1 levansucrase [Streptomyces phaeolivaceus]
MHPHQSPSQAYLASVAARLATDGCQTWWEDWGGVPVLIGRRADFRLRWLGKMHLFTMAIAVPEITMATIGTFTFQAMEYAKRIKGGLPAGVQTGIGIFPVLVSDRVDPAAMQWAEAQARHDWGIMARPVVVDSARQYVGICRRKGFVGRAYASHMLKKGTLYLDGR